MCFSPLFGFLGDRYSRKRIIIAGMIIWIVTVFASTFIPANLFWLFALSRGIVGIGQASFTVISPSVIGDLFSGDARSRMLMFLYLAIPFGSGLGFIISSTVAAFAGDWHWGVRVTAPFGILFIVLVIVLTVDPERGSADDKDPHHGHAKAGHTGFLEDLWSLIKKLKITVTRTFLFICITAACFNWATNVNMVLSVVVPYQRNAATACQVAISHLFGDSFGPYLLGLVRQQPKENESPREAAGIGLSALKGSQTVQDGDGESNSQRSGSYSQPDGDATSATKEDSKTTLGSRENEEG
ncbi:unnamed protein product [Nippostrongylus brasiliensis]|uniref:MFS domain-containing protein n=1 Tax=Nippostrongylus brasiliensis TaxID=27835 RepID=A0A0N4XDY0_NIPBR|nr:unnamed protein product [Nippostrongylus brasiliensis]